MKRAGFTMIELIFVIVILGILAAVALPKFIGVSEQAEAGKCKAFYGTLSRTVGPAIWADMVLNDMNETAAFTATAFKAQITIPKGCVNADDVTTDAAWNDIIDVATVENSSFTVKVGETNYDVNGTKASTNAAPLWEWSKQP